MMRSMILLALAIMLGLPQLARAEIKTMILAGGCFWCLQHDMKQIKGVVEAKSGYAGGDRPQPTYQDYNKLSEAYKTAHLEVVEIKYDSTVISPKELIRYFLRKIDPTDGEGQFCDRGSYYRPAIFISSDAEKFLAESEIKLGEAAIKKTFSVDLLPSAAFWAAEDYHQDYAEKNPLQYKFYRYRCGRDARVEDVWGKQ
ncbi:MAG: peptide-methionine (S)-S-oxide reductase MsrA [Alphaproteobacteria bacterium]